MEKNRLQKSLYSKLLQMTLIPIFILALVITSFSVKSFATALNGEVKKGLMDLSSAILTLYDQLYPGDYQIVMQNAAIYMLKGDHQINGDFSIIDSIKESTGADITFFYQDTRVITTLYDKDGERMTGTKVNAVVVRDVLTQGKAAFYPSVDIDGEDYFAYYAPLINEDGTCIGMLFVAKPSRRVNDSLRRTIVPIILLGFAAMVIAAWFTVRFSGKLMQAIHKIEEFLSRVAEGDLSGSLDHDVVRRNDELGELGRYAVDMQKSLSELVEKDALTGLFNRRSGDKKLHQVHQGKKDGNNDFCVALGDIDFFKKVNDTFGHEWGDVVLEQAAQIMRSYMTGKGFVSRWGGEEFLIVFTGYKLKEAVRCLEEMLNEIRAMEIAYDEETIIRVTMTFGICQGNTDSINAILREADSKLYIGKNNGRNQIVQ